MSNNPTDLSNLTLPPIAEVTATTPRRERRRKAGFVLVPWPVVHALVAITTDKSWLVLMHILYETWRNGGRPIKLPNGMLRRLGVSRNSKSVALKKLEQHGLIEVEWRGRKSPIITVRQ